MMECIICCNHYKNNRYRCLDCSKEICKDCYHLLSKCPFCRISYQKFEENKYVYSDWNHSKILRKKIRQELKRQQHEYLKIRNAYISRLHNRTSSNT